MSAGGTGYGRALRWYPPAWRARYGGELTALLEDTYGSGGRVPGRARFELVRAGLAERAREAGLVGPAGGPSGRVRGGSVLVLGAFGLFLVAGAMFGKFTDQWSGGTPASARTLPQAGYDVVAAAALVAAVLVGLAALVVLPSFVSLLRAGRWAEVRGPVLRAVVAVAVGAAFVASTAAWSHSLSVHDRNGGLSIYSWLFVVLSVSVVVAIVLGTLAAAAVAQRVELPDRMVRALGWLALGVTAALVVVFGGIVTWWAAEAASTPTVLAGGIGNGFVFTSSSVPPVLLLAGVLMLAALALAAAGSVRVVRAMGPR